MTLSPTSRRRTAIASAFALVAGLLTLSAPLSASADVVGDGPSTISGTVTLADGTPVADVYVNVSSSFGEGTMWGYSTNTDVNGAYEFTGLPTGAVTVGIYAPGYELTAPQSFTLTEASPSASADFVVVPFTVGTGTISGVVTADGAPLPFASVSAYNQQTSQNVFTSADENGAYVLSALSTGLWSVSAWGGPQYQLVSPQYLEISEASPSATADFAFESWPTGTSAIGGTVTDVQTGEPVAYASVSVYGVDVAHQSNTTTDESGTFSVELLPAGTYTLTYFMPGYLHSSREVTVAADETAAADYALVPANSTVSGHVQTADGTPVEGIWVVASAGNNVGSGVTNASGDYIISGLGALEYTLTIGGPGTPYDAQEVSVLPIASGDVSADFTLVARTTGSLGGWVLGESGDILGSPVCATLYGSKNKKPLADVVTFGPEFGDGTYSFADLKPGSYTVQFRDCDDDPKTKFDKVYLGGVKNYKDATFVTIVAGEDSYQNDVVLTQRH